MCMSASGGVCMYVCVFVSLLRLLSRIDRGLLKPNDGSGEEIMADLRAGVTS